ncbi:MAG TPA: cytidine deaminase [Stellaceae bacterium]|nr:cytidine deaminase [Stellaceae bacterium]
MREAWRAALGPAALGALTLEDALTLIEEARAARERAYAPYSHFQVGAALRVGNGRIFAGVNVENASYGATICAERAAVFAAVSAGHRDFTALAVLADLAHPVAPCGLCRQVLAEFTRTAPVIMANLKGAIAVRRVEELLPLAFALPE